MAGMARALGSLLDACRYVPTCVVGHSAGAAVAVRLALDGGLSPSCTIIGLNAALLPFGGAAGAVYAALARLLAAAPLVPHLAAWRARDPAGIRRLIDATGSRLDADGVACYARLLSNPDHIAGVLAMMANWDLNALAKDLPSLRQPLHLLVGERDRAVPPAQVAAVARRVAGARVHRLPELGHLMHEEAPALLADRIVALSRASN
jgi:magnesium chelatase accessory protein